MGYMAMSDEVVTLTQELIAIDTSNWGESEHTVGEAAAADYCADRLREVGYDRSVSGSPRRSRTP